MINTEDSQYLNLAGDYVLTVTDEQIRLYRSDSTQVAQWDLDDIPRFRLQKLHQLNDSEKIFIVNLARWVLQDLKSLIQPLFFPHFQGVYKGLDKFRRTP